MVGFAIACGVVFVAELGDKSQLLTLAFATRYRPLVVLLGVAIAAIVLDGAAALAGGLLADAIPERPVSFVAGLAFLGFAWWTLRDEGDDRDEREGADQTEGLPERSTRSAVITVVATFLVAEIGDKTMLATAGLASRVGTVAAWSGAVTGMLAANAIALVVGRALHRRVPTHVMRQVAAAAFALVGVVLVIEAVR